MENEPRNIPRSEEELNSPDDKDVSIEGPLVSMPFAIEESVGVPEYDTTHESPNNNRREKLKLGRKRRFVEGFIEQSIKGLAFISIAAIVLIFVFVFREASPMFFDSEATGEKANIAATSDGQFPTTTNGGKIAQEIYDPKGIYKAETAQHDGSTEYKTSTGDGVVEQQVYDPFADEATADTATPLAAPVAVSQAKTDSIAAAEKRIAEDASNATDIDKLFIDTWQPVSQVPKYGLIPLFIGTLKVTLLALLFATPLAVLAALYTSTFAPKWAREFVKPAIELLAGFPSVVIGFFALIVMATFMQDLFGYQFRLNSLIGGIAMSFAVIPIIYTISEDALVSVPKSLKEASDALGATKWQTAWRVVLPAAVPGVFAAVVLGFGRAFGETMIALMATGNAPLSSWNILEPVRTFSATIGAEMAEVVFGDQHYNVLFFIGALLFIFTFTMNAVVEFWVRKRLLRRIQGR
ncbi:MAG TPA: phosphate ABC transporter permease subunit PstC [Candidatus Kapabacteria bacterium]|nr:phosphate ABC transporter permease subunit PstC [Candidatus Kapabacteria bacterium]